MSTRQRSVDLQFFFLAARIWTHQNLEVPMAESVTVRVLRSRADGLRTKENPQIWESK